MSALRSSSALLFLTALAASPPAWAWDWDDEPEQRQWRTATLDWAQDMAWDELGETWTHAELQAEIAPPPRELWCVEAPAPTQQDCQTLNTRVRTWLRAFLEVPAGDPLPLGLPVMPAECSSICAS